MTAVQGEVASRFGAVRDAFEANFRDHGDVGAAFCLYVDGEKVVDLWGGIADQTTGRPWEEDTTALVFSTTKGVTAICAHLLAQRGKLDLDAPVVDYWPEFGQAGKDAITTRTLLAHRAGLATVSESISPEEVFEWDPIVKLLAAEEPAWEPGTAHGYHALTFGWLVGEVIRRITGKSIGQFFADEIAGPLGLDFWIGLPASEEPRVARLLTLAALGGGDRPGGDSELPDLESLPEEVRELAAAFLDPNSYTQRALNVTTPAMNFNNPALHAAEIPAANGIGTARSLACLYAACVGEIDGERVLEPATVSDATREQSNGPDRTLIVPTRFGSGFFLTSSFSPLFGPSSFGHAGAGGSLAFADPDAKVGFGYVMNKMQQGLAGDPRTLTLIDAVKQWL